MTGKVCVYPLRGKGEGIYPVIASLQYFNRLRGNEIAAIWEWGGL